MLEDIGKLLAGEWAVISNAPLSFAAAVLVIGFLIWRAMEWKYGATLEGMDRRIALRDDTIAHLEKNAHAAPVQLREIRSDVSTPILSEKPSTTEPIVFLGEGVTIEHLTGLYAGLTRLQGDKLAQPFIGKWIAISGTIEIITALDDVATTLTVLLHSEGQKRISAWMMFPGDRDRLEAIPQGGEIRAAGKIQKLSEYEFTLLECYLL